MGLHRESSYVSSNQLTLWVRSLAVAATMAPVLLVLSFAQMYSASQKPVLIAGAERINPNTAPVGSLVRLPGIGTARAMDIIHYRQTSEAEGPVFQMLADMENIKGIGPKTAEKMAPYLIFETAGDTE